MIKSYPYVVVADGTKDPAHYAHLALVDNWQHSLGSLEMARGRTC